MSDGAPALDVARLIRTLRSHGVRYVVVGGVAGQQHGATRVTDDFDICPEWTDTNLDALAHALTELGAELKIGEGSIETLRLKIDGQTIHNTELGAWRTEAGDMDVLLGIPQDSRWELARYDALSANATTIGLDGITITVASLADIIRSKEIADRPKDRAALIELRRLAGEAD